MAQRLTLESPDDLLTRGQAARILGVKPNTLAVWACNRRYDLPYVKVGSLVKYRRRDLLAFVERRTVGPATSQ